MATGDGRNGDVLRERIRKALQSQKQRTVTILSSLLAVQDELHYLPEEAIEETAAFSESTINEVWSVASFYTNFRFTPPGDHTVSVCWGPSCHILGAQAIMKRMHDELGLDNEGETDDGKITLQYATCHGACANAPVVAVDHHHMGRMDPDKTAKIVNELRSS